ncbi:MAG: hypothetical protein AAF481_12325 [Acidobacteriota bacterium]
MLTLEPPFYRVRDLLFFRDDADEDLFHYLPGRPRLAEDGRGDDRTQRFTLYKYRRDLTDNPELDPTRGRGAGLALFETELPAERLEVARAEIASQSGRPDAKLSPVVFRSGTVATLVAHAEGDGLVEDLVDLHPAPLTPPHRSAFAVALSAEGASLFEQAARGGELPIGIVYDLRFLALTPSLHATVKMDYERIYDRFAASVGFTYYVSVKLDVDLAWLVENDVIQIEITSFTDGEDAQRQQDQVMALVKARILGDFFRSGVPPKQQRGQGALGELLGGLMGGEGEITSASAFFTLKARYEAVRESKHHEMIFAGRTAIELPHTAVGLLSTLTGDDEVEIKVEELDLDDPFYSSLAVQVSSAIDFDSLPDLQSAVVHLRHGNHRKAFEFKRGGDNEGGQFEVALTDPQNDEYTWEVEYHFNERFGAETSAATDAEAGDGTSPSSPLGLSSGPSQITAGPFDSRSRVLVLDPFEHFRYRTLRIRSDQADEVARYRVHLRLRDEETRDELESFEILLDPQHPNAIWRHRLTPPDQPFPQLLIRTDWEDLRGEIHPGEEQEIIGGTYEARDPFHDQLEITLHPVADWERISQLVVDLRYRDGDLAIDRTLPFTAETDTARTEKWALLDVRNRTYSWRQTLIRKDGTVHQTDWQDADQTVLVVGQDADPPPEIRIVWVGDPGDALGLRVDLWPTLPNGEDGVKLSTFLRAGEMEGRLTLPAGTAEGELRYRYAVSRFSAGGEEPVKEDRGTGGLLVVQTG